MGKSIIIKGANFYQNSVNVPELGWYMGLADSVLNGSSAFANTNKFFIKPTEMEVQGVKNKLVSYIKAYASIDGTIEVGSCSTTDGTVISSSTYNVRTGINIIHLTSSITLTDSVSIYISGKDILTYWPNTSGYGADHGWKFAFGSGDEQSNRIPIDFGNTEE